MAQSPDLRLATHYSYYFTPITTLKKVGGSG